MTEHDQLPSELAELINAERAAAVAPAAERAAVRTKIAASAGKAALGQAAASTAIGGVGKVIAVVAITVAGGAAALVARRHSETAPPPKTSAPAQQAHVVPTPDATPIALPGAESVVVDASPSEPPPVAVVSRPTRAVSVAPPAPSPAAATVIPSQPELVRRAWAALKSADAAGALEIVKQDRSEHPDGPLEEERDAIEVLALIKLQPNADARAVATGFLNRYPASIHRGLIERAVAERKEVQ